MAKGKDNKRPKGTGKPNLPTPAEPTSSDSLTPKFCLQYLQRGYDINNLPQNQRASFAMALQERCTMTWREITVARYGGLGIEFIPASQIRGPIPVQFQDRDRFLMLRYHDRLPFGGVRVQDVLHVLWIEARYGDLYNHGP